MQAENFSYILPALLAGISLCPCPFQSQAHRIMLLLLNIAISSWGLYMAWFQTKYQEPFHSYLQSSHSRAPNYASYSELHSVCLRIVCIRRSEKINYTNLRASKVKRKVIWLIKTRTQTPINVTVTCLFNMQSTKYQSSTNTDTQLVQNLLNRLSAAKLIPFLSAMTEAFLSW